MVEKSTNQLLGCTIALDLRRHRARADVVGDPKERRLVHRTLMQGGQRLVTLGGVERDAHGRDQLVEFRIVDEAPVVGHRSRHLGIQEADHGKERIHRRVSHVGGVSAAGRFVLGAFTPVGEQRVPLDHVEFDVEEALGKALLHEFIHRQRKHLAGAGRGRLRLDLELLVLREARFRHQLAGFIRIELDLELRIAAPGMTRLERAGGRNHQARSASRPSWRCGRRKDWPPCERGYRSRASLRCG